MLFANCFESPSLSAMLCANRFESPSFANPFESPSLLAMLSANRFKSPSRVAMLFANRFGRCFQHRKERFNLQDLKPGDHIVEERWLTYWHHMIVESVDLEKKQINVIHYYNRYPKVWRTLFIFTPDKFYRIVYEDGECLPASEVLKKAQARVGEEQPIYCPYANNCEHFATECKTGEKECHQIWTAIEILAKSVISTFLPLLVSHQLYNKLDSLKLDSQESDSQNQRVKKFEVLKCGRYGAVFFPKAIKWAFFTAFAIETQLLYWDYYDAKVKFDQHKLSREEFCKVIVKRVCAAVCSIPGFVLSFYVSGLITSSILHFPFLGNLGQWVLPVVCGAVGDFLSKVAGGKLGELITPLFIKYLAVLKHS